MHYDTLIIGSIAQDTNIDYGGEIMNVYGGAVYYAGYSGAAVGVKAAVLAKGNTDEVDFPALFAGAKGLDVYPVHSPENNRITNTYTTPDRETRISVQPSCSTPFTLEEIPEGVTAETYQLAGMWRGEYSDEFIKELSGRGAVALDIQGILRCVDEETREAFFSDWETKHEMLKYIRYLKTDANEARILTGLDDRYEAARLILGWGCPEVVITHHTEVIAATNEGIWAVPLRPENLSGRTGRGDTTFSAYVNMRHHNDLPTALRYAAACVSLKMGAPGPFSGTREDVEAYLERYYQDVPRAEKRA